MLIKFNSTSFQACSEISPRSITTLLQHDSGVSQSIQNTVKSNYFWGCSFNSDNKISQLESLRCELENTGPAIKIQLKEKYTKHDIMQKIIFFAQIRDLTYDQEKKFTYSIDSGIGLFGATNPKLNLWVDNALVLNCDSYELLHCEKTGAKKILPETEILYLLAGNLYSIDNKKHEARIMYRSALKKLMSACSYEAVDIIKTVDGIEGLYAKFKEFNIILDAEMENLIGHFFKTLGEFFVADKKLIHFLKVLELYELAKSHYLMAENEDAATEVNDQLNLLKETIIGVKRCEENPFITVVESRNDDYTYDIYIKNEWLGSERSPESRRSRIIYNPETKIGNGNMGTVYMCGGDGLVTKHVHILEYDQELLQIKIDKTMFLHNNLRKVELGSYVLLNYYEKNILKSNKEIYIGRAVPNRSNISAKDIDENIRCQILEITSAIHVAGGFALDTKPDNFQFGLEEGIFQQSDEKKLYRIDMDMDIELLAIMDRYPEEFIFLYRVIDIMTVGNGYEKACFYMESNKDHKNYLVKKLLCKNTDDPMAWLKKQFGKKADEDDYEQNQYERIKALLRIRGLLGAVIAFLPKYMLVEQHDATKKYTPDEIDKFSYFLQQNVSNWQPKNWCGTSFKNEVIDFILNWFSITVEMDDNDKKNLDKVIVFIDKYSAYIKSQQAKLPS